jgi:NAD(P)-dependent dehydrogenase (short-subunit alcohol dehydrogenase family)
VSEPSGKAFEGKTLVISGASSGIGRAVAIHLAQQGAGLVLVARDRKRLEETAQLANAKSCRILELDLTQPANIVPAIQETSTAVGRLYGLCHAAGTVETLQWNATNSNKLQAMLQVNYLGGMELARAISRRDIMNEDGGSILFISSICTIIGAPGRIAYSGSKGAVTAAARAIAIELARRNVRVNVLSPGIVRTEMTEKSFYGLSTQQVQALKDTHPLGFGTPEDVARAATFLLSPENKWITAADLVIDGGCSAQ